MSKFEHFYAIKVCSETFWWPVVKLQYISFFCLYMDQKIYTSKAKVGLQNIEKVLFSFNFLKKLLVFKYV